MRKKIWSIFAISVCLGLVISIFIILFNVIIKNKASIENKHVGKVSSQGIAEQSKILGQNRKIIDDALDKIRKLAASGNVEEALTECKQLLQSYPESNDINILLSEIYILKSNYEKAHKLIDRVLKNDPKNGWALRVKATIYMNENLLYKAEKYFLRAVENGNKWEQGLSYYNLAKIYNIGGNKSKAIDYINKASKLCPNNQLVDIEHVRITGKNKNAR
jgi:tetratricopeptide (TPR) repeat protein